MKDAWVSLKVITRKPQRCTRCNRALFTKLVNGLHWFSCRECDRLTVIKEVK